MILPVRGEVVSIVLQVVVEVEDDEERVSDWTMLFFVSYGVNVCLKVYESEDENNYVYL